MTREVRIFKFHLLHRVSHSIYQTPLHLAAITNNIEVIRIMLESGANPNEADRNGQTTIHHACYNRNSPCMSVIFKYSTFKIDLEKKNFNGKIDFKSE